MLRFHPLCEADRPAVEKKMGNNPARICELCPADFFYWGLNGDAEVAYDKDDLYIRWIYEAENGYAYPYAENEDAALEKIAEHAKSLGKEPSFLDMTAEQAKKVEKKLGVQATADRDWFDYLYLAEDLKNLSGKKYHGQKNHYNHFLKTYPDAVFTSYDVTMLDKALAFEKKYYATEKPSGMLFNEEREVFLSRLKNVNRSERSGVLFVDGEIVAITFGEVLGDTLFVHTEKALREYVGSYVAINTKFVNACLQSDPNIVYVNREEDLGQEGLRKAKSDLHPVLMVEKYFVRLV